MLPPHMPVYLPHSGHYERIPYNHSTMCSIYHIRQYNIIRLSLSCASPLSALPVLPR